MGRGVSGKVLWDYLSTDGDEAGPSTSPPIGRAFGSGAAQLGLTTINQEQFEHLAAGRSLTGDKLIQTNGGKHVSGIDVVFAAPKWASVLMVNSSPENRAKIQEQWEEAVEAVAYRMERDAPAVRRPVPAHLRNQHDTRRQGVQTERVPGGLVGFIAQHHTARPTKESLAKGLPPDPHLHTHVFLFNMAWTGSKWRAIDDYGIKIQAEQRLHELEGEFSRRMEMLGYPISYKEDTKGRFRSVLRGMPEATLAFLSKNAERAKALSRQFEVDNLRPPTPAELRNLMYRSRKAKAMEAEHDIDWIALQKALADEGHEAFDVAPGDVSRGTSIEGAMKFLRQRLGKATGVCKADAAFTAKAVRDAVARCSVGLGMSLEELDTFAEIYTREHLVPLSEHRLPDFNRFTSKATLTQEKVIAEVIAEKAQDKYQAVDEVELAKVIEQVEREVGYVFDAEQRDLIVKVCSESGWVNVSGVAGSGKGASMLAAVTALRKKQVDSVIAISMARDTAQRTGAKLGADRSDSIESFIRAVRLERIKPDDKTLIVIDEAVMIDTPRMAQLLSMVGKARIVCIGDALQLQCIGAGGWYADQAQKFGSVHLTKTHRQKSQLDVQALTDLRNGKARQALEAWEAAQRVHITDTAQERVGAVVEAYKRHRQTWDSSEVKVVVEGTNQEIDVVNRLIQAHRLQTGEIKGDGLKMQSSLSEREWTIYEGDEVSFVETYFDPSQTLSVPNGTKAIVDKIGPGEVRLKIQDKTVMVKVDEKADSQPFGPSYAVHALRLQGGEVPVVLVMPSSSSTLESGYSMLSRCINEVHMFMDHATHGKDPVRTLERLWQKPAPKQSATSQLQAFQAAHPQDLYEDLGQETEMQTAKERIAAMKENLVRSKAEREDDDRMRREHRTVGRTL